MDNTKWYDKPECDSGEIISSRVRLARNLVKHPFPARLNKAGIVNVMNLIKNSVSNDRVPEIFNYHDLTDAKGEYLLELLERHVISGEMTIKSGPRAFMLSADESASILLNEEDHVRIQTVNAGDNIDEAYNYADKIDDLIEESVEFAFDEEFGYLTSCPTNTGTGLRASYMLHIPAIEHTSNLRGIMQAVSKFGIAVRGIHGEGSEPSGSIYQISNQTTLGKPEKEVITALKRVTSQIIEQERQIRQTLFSERHAFALDKIYRAYGALTNSRILTINEAMALLSDVRLGYITGNLDKPRPKKTVYAIMMDVQRGGIMKRAGRIIDDNEMDILRADYIRGIFTNE